MPTTLDDMSNRTKMSIVGPGRPANKPSPTPLACIANRNLRSRCNVNDGTILRETKNIAPIPNHSDIKNVSQNAKVTANQNEGTRSDSDLVSTESQTVESASSASSDSRIASILRPDYSKAKTKYPRPGMTIDGWWVK